MRAYSYAFNNDAETFTSVECILSEHELAINDKHLEAVKFASEQKETIPSKAARLLYALSEYSELLSKVLYLDFMSKGSQKEKAKKLGISIRKYQNHLTEAMHWIRGYEAARLSFGSTL